MLHIREARVSDARDLAALATQMGYPSQPEDSSRRLGSLPFKRSCVLVAVVEGKTVGWVHANLYSTLVTDDVAAIYGLAVAEERQGHGIGRALMKAAEDWAVGAGCTTMYVRSNIARRGAHGFYRRLGYQPVKSSLLFTKSL
jgi:GNAT superfamily N-acetyltransferase